MCSPSGFILILIASLYFNCLQFVYADDNNDGISSSNNKGILGVIEEGGAGVARTLRIDITRKSSVQLNGVEIDENSLVDHLEDHEREFIFGKSKTKRAVKLVHLRHRTDVGGNEAVAVSAVATTKKSATASASRQSKPQQRVKRAAINSNSSNKNNRNNRSKNGTGTIDNATERQSSGGGGAAQQSQEVSVQIQDNEQLVNIKLRQTPKLIDDAFIFIRRYANSTQFMEDSHKLAEKYERCFYSNENSALDLCDDENVRGVFHHNSTDYIIHPLPSRFGNSTHVILESSNVKRTSSPHVHQADTIFDSNSQFEPDEEDFNERNIKNFASEEVEKTSHTTRYSNNFSNYDVINQQLNGNIQSQQIPLQLRYKPNHHHHDHSHYQHHHQHYEQHQQSKNRQHHQQQHSKHKRQQYNTNKNQQHPQQQHTLRQRRHISTSGSQWSIPQVLHIETAIFVDSDLFKHMAKNFPRDTEKQIMRFVLAMINGVQLLYHHPSLGHRINFVLKRLEILYKDPKDLQRSSDIDTYLSNFCMWQKGLNPTSDDNSVHYDHAVILTGYDLYVVGKNGKYINQVVGLAPVAGMCTSTSSCTINEGKHFESVFVVAHEIGHNLGMRHDTNENSCDSTLYIMSPTLGSGKITWSKCSRTYLNEFLGDPQAKCLFDRGQFLNNLDHAAEGLLPGERFDANQQCMLKYGRESVSARNQLHSDICHDLHCQRERYTWTSHPALEGTICGENMWCRSGVCEMRPKVAEAYSAPKQILNSGKPGYDKANFLESTKMGHLLHEYNYNKLSTWGEWGKASECDSGCLYGPSKRLREGSTGYKTYSRRCLDYRRRCLGRDRKFESCVAKQCYSKSIAITTIEGFATQVCEKAAKFDTELTGEGEQIVGDIEESCKIFCKTKSNGTKSRSWTFPDGTTCRSKLYNFDDTSYCIAGRCEKFSCDNSTNNYYKIDPIFCKYSHPSQQSPTDDVENKHLSSYNHMHQQTQTRGRQSDRGSASSSSLYSGNVGNRDGTEGISGPTTVRNKYENEVAVRNFHGQQHDQPYKRKSEPYPTWSKYNNHVSNQQPAAPPPPVSASLVRVIAPTEPEWIVQSGCHSSCMAKSKGVQVVSSRRTGANNIQLCTHTVKPCERLQTPTEHAENTCARYKLKVRGLSGYGTQIAASIDEPDRSCRVGCQDEFIKYRFYLVNGKYGHFPLGTKCSNTEERYCVNGKCLEFGSDNIPLKQSHISLALFRKRRSLDANTPMREASSSITTSSKAVQRQKRSYLYYNPVNITETITQEFLNNIINSILNFEQRHLADELISDDHIEFTNPIHVSTDELNERTLNEQ